jgi:hypothetical protein
MSSHESIYPPVIGIEALKIVGKLDQLGFNSCIITDASAFINEGGLASILYNCEGPKE